MRGAYVKIAKEEPSIREGLYREVGVLRLNDNRVGRPPPREVDVREARYNGVGCGGNSFS